MAYSDFLCDLDQEYCEFQDRIGDEWRVTGESDGEEGFDPKYPSNSAYLDGYNEGRARYINRLADFTKKPASGQLCHCGLVREQDCNCASDWSDEF